MDNRKSRSWEKVREKGLGSFIVNHGLIRWAIPNLAFTWMVVFLVIPVVFDGSPPDLEYFRSEEFFRGIIAGAVLFPIAGVLWARWEWHRQEHKFRRSLRSDVQA